MISAISKGRILIVEDESIVAMDMRRSLSVDGYVITNISANAADAIASCLTDPPDLVLMDIHLSNSDGILAAEEIYRRFSIPVVFVTGNSDQATIARATGSNPFGWVCKPIVHRNLTTAIDIAIARSRSYDASRVEALWLRSQLASLEDGVICTDHRGIVRCMNPAAERLLGIPQKMLFGHHIGEALALRFATTGAPTGNLLRLALLHGGSLHLDAPVFAGNCKTSLDAEIHIAYVNAEVIGAVFTFRSINDRRLRRSSSVAALLKSGRQDCTRVATSLQESLTIAAREISPLFLPAITIETQRLNDDALICANRRHIVGLVKDLVLVAARRLSNGRISLLSGCDSLEAKEGWVRIISDGTRLGSSHQYTAFLDGTLLIDSQLARVYAMAESVHGHVRYERSGSLETWMVYFPLHRSEPNLLAGDSAIILLLEEDDLIRSHICNCLSSAAYECLGARTMDEVVELNDLYKEHSRILLCPSSYFSSTVSQLRASDPLLRVLIMGSEKQSAPGFDLAVDWTVSLKALRSAIDDLYKPAYSNQVLIEQGR